MEGKILVGIRTKMLLVRTPTTGTVKSKRILVRTPTTEQKKGTKK